MTEDVQIVLVILAIAILTYFTRAGGYVLLSRFRTLHPRVEAALQAVPTAVMVTLVVPTTLTAGLAEIVGVFAAGIAATRLSAMPVILIGLLVIMAGRASGF